MRSKNLDRGIDGGIARGGTDAAGRTRAGGAEPDLGRRRVLVAIGGLPLAVTVAGVLAACSPKEESSGSAAPDAGTTPPAKPAAPAKPPAAAKPASPGAASPATDPVGGGASAAPEDALVTEVAAMQPTVQALQYVNQSAKPDQHCSNCQFYTATTEERGKCQLFQQGLVSAGGWCASWTKKLPS